MLELDLKNIFKKQQQQQNCSISTFCGACSMLNSIKLLLKKRCLYLHFNTHNSLACQDIYFNSSILFARSSNQIVFFFFFLPMIVASSGTLWQQPVNLTYFIRISNFSLETQKVVKRCVAEWMEDMQS